jgi:hypothetical protein
MRCEVRTWKKLMMKFWPSCISIDAVKLCWPAAAAAAAAGKV